MVATPTLADLWNRYERARGTKEAREAFRAWRVREQADVDAAEKARADRVKARAAA